MKIKLWLIALSLFLGQFAYANMASPVWEGTKTSSPIFSKDIDILSEKIFIRIDPKFQTAKFMIEYIIQSDFTARQIPLLFYAQDYKENFIVEFGNTKLTTQYMSDKYSDYPVFESFEKALKKDEIVIYWQENIGSVYKLNDLKYFEADIEQGIDTVRVEYTANVWTDNSGWVKEFSFRYSLTPAKYWKSFGRLEVVLEQDGGIRQLSTNLGLPTEQQINRSSTWVFNTLPADYIVIAFTPEVTGLAKFLIAVKPFGLAAIVTIALALIHWVLVVYYRQNNVQKKYSFIVFAGSICVPFLSLLVYMYSFDLIDNVIGENAGKHHGYVFLSFVFYPVMLAFYLGLFWVIDSRYKKKLVKSDNNIHNIRQNLNHHNRSDK